MQKIDKLFFSYNKFPLILRVAYGKKVGSLEQLKEFWHNGKDFQSNDGWYCSIRDVVKLLEDYAVQFVIVPTTSTEKAQYFTFEQVNQK